MTPVIIKIGGGTDLTNTPGPNTITIESLHMPFDDDQNGGNEWKKTRSSKPGRINEVTLTDGNLETVYFAVTPSFDALTTFELLLSLDGPETLVFEEKQDENGAIGMEIRSAVPFQIKRPAPGGWKESTLTLAKSPVMAILTQKAIGPGVVENNFTFEYSFNHSNIDFSLDFHVTPPEE